MPVASQPTPLRNAIITYVMFTYIHALVECVEVVGGEILGLHGPVEGRQHDAGHRSCGAMCLVWWYLKLCAD